MKEDKLLNRVPITVPTNNRKNILLFPFFKTTLKSIIAKVTIKLADNKKFIVLFTINIDVDPKIKTTKVCTKPYNESRPIILGVIILLFVIVWNNIDATEIVVPAIKIPNTFGILIDKLNL